MGPNADNIRRQLEERYAYHLREAERIKKLLEAVSEAERYLRDPDRPTVQQSMVLPPHVSSGPVKSDRERIREALSNMPETFTSHDLWVKACNDGLGQINKRTSFAPYFTRLLKQNMVIQIQPPKGNKPGIYRIEKQNAEPSG